VIDAKTRVFQQYLRIAVVHCVAVTGASRDRVLTVARLALRASRRITSV
jgi:hypothetical protein